jgi:hypothetical protein
METIRHPVGIRNGTTTMTNEQGDVQMVTGLLDRIPQAKGGKAAAPGQWSADRTTLIRQVATAIVSFQTANHLHKTDGVVDPGGTTIKLMNQLAGPAPVSATVARGDNNSQLWVVAEPSSLSGSGPLRPRDISPQITRKLVSVTGTSIKWFGVVVPLDKSGGVAGGSPHLFFTPGPGQGGYADGGYDQFTKWNGLWDKYTSIVGSQIVVAGAPHILVIPFYQNSQIGSLGSFLTNWKEVVSAVITAAINSIDPLFLRKTFEFDQIFSSSFSSGNLTHQNFHTKGADVSSMTRMAFCLDGMANGTPLNWSPPRAVAPSIRTD